MARELEFHTAVMQKLGKDRGLNRKDILKVAAETGIPVPGIAWKNKVENKRGVFDLDHLKAGAVVEKGKAKVIGANNIATLLGLSLEKGNVLIAGKYVLQERLGNGQLKAVQPSDAAAALAKAVAQHNPNEKKRVLMSTTQMFSDLEDLIELVAEAFANAVFVYGGPGIGKTWTVHEKLEALGKVRGKDYHVVSGKVTTAALYQVLYMHRKKGLIVFDDTDSAWETDDSANILKAALDSYDERTISWLSNRTVNVTLWDDDKRAEYEEKVDKILAGYEQNIVSDDGDDETSDLIDEALGEDEDAQESHLAKLRRLKFPSEFKFDAQVIFVSNKRHEHIDPAVLSRCLKIDMTLTTEQMWDRVEDLMKEMAGDVVTMEQKKDVLQELRNKAALGELVDPNMRTFVAACKMVASGKKNWKNLVRYT